MTHKSKSVLAAVALALSASAAGAADFGDMFSVRGFGTLGVTHSTEDQADFRESVFQPDGAGLTRDWDFRSNTRFATQVNVNFTDELSVVVQALSQYQADRTFAPKIEWANIKYAFTPEFSARVGRIALPTFMLSDSRLVGYANAWVRPPIEVYQVSSITSNDGMDISFSKATGGLRNTVQAFYGTSEADLPEGGVEADSIWGANYHGEVGNASFRVSYIAMDLDINVPSVEPLLGGFSTLGAALSGFGFTSAGNQALSLAEKYKLDDMNLSFLSLGGTYDSGNWFVMAEAIDFGGDGLLSDTRAGYVSGGVRLGKFTPYATIAKLDADIDFDSGVSTTGLPGAFVPGVAALNAGLNMSQNQFVGSQDSASLGVRWDFMSSFALKAQYDYINLGDNSAGRTVNATPDFEAGGTFSVFSLTVDFVF